MENEIATSLTLLAMTEEIVIVSLPRTSLRAKRGNLGGGDNVRFFAEFILKGLRMTGCRMRSPCR